MKLFNKFKTCNRCLIIKSISDFHKNASGKDGFHTHCKTCYNTYYRKYYSKNKMQVMARCHNYYLNNKKKYYINNTKRHLKQKYNLTIETFDDYLKQQQNKCAICGKSNKSQLQKFSIDHCHKTGKIRGLLCKKCNTGLGSLKTIFNCY